MKRLCVLLVLFGTICDAPARRRLEIRASPVPSAQVIDATHLRRHSKGDIEVVIVQQARPGLLTFHLDGRAIAKLDYAEWIRLYLSPGRYRFGVVPSYSFGRGSSPEMKADVRANSRQTYRIFQSAGFTSSGGNAVYEVARIE
jgi:hypothetical protein